ncbi:MAG: hypothetical protein ACI865_002655 [Flavobacteriaceae bacterium]|jgi:hypothetical protein
MKINYILLTALAFVYLVSCKPEIIAPDIGTGDLDASVFVAIGSDGTAGYANDALHSNGQENSFAAILSKQINLVTTSSFNQPLISSNSTGVSLDSNSRLILGYKTDCKGETSLSPVREGSLGDIALLGTSIYNNASPFHNVGVPGAGILDVNTSGYGNPANGVGNYNPFYARIAASQVTGSILEDAENLSPTFFSIELGESDIMTYAKSGATSTTPTPAVGSAGVGFEGSLDEIVNALYINGAKGIISNVPNVIDYPYFTTIPYNGLNLDADKAATLTTVFSFLGLTFTVGDNPFLIKDAAEPFGVRQMVEGELVLLSVPLDSVKCLGLGSITGISNEHVLTLTEIADIQLRTSDYNAVISTIALTYNLAFVDKESLINSLNSGIVYNGVAMNTSFITGGAFSLDGRNLNPNGQALLANKYIESINTAFNSRIPYASVVNYPGIIFP